MALFSDIVIYVALFVTGYILRQRGVVNKAHAASLLKFVVYVALPTLIIGSISIVDITPYMAILPLSASIISAITGLVGFFLIAYKPYPFSEKGVLIISAMIMNLAIVYPMVVSRYGEEGLARLILFDLGNALMAFTVVYLVAAYYGKTHGNLVDALIKVLRFPPFIALIIAITINLFIPINQTHIFNTMSLIGSWLVLCVFPALGMYTRWRAYRLGLVVQALFTRVIVGGLTAFILIILLPLDPLSQLVVLLAASAPVGFNTLVFAADQGLDEELAANIASIAVIAAMVYLPLFLFFLEVEHFK